MLSAVCLTFLLAESEFQSPAKETKEKTTNQGEAQCITIFVCGVFSFVFELKVVYHLVQVVVLLHAFIFPSHTASVD